MNTVSSSLSPSSLLTSRELSEATHYLTSTRDLLFEALTGLSDSQWHFKPAPDRWSIAEILEHHVLVEEAIHAIVGQMQGATLADGNGTNSQVEEFIRVEVPKRSARFSSPPQFLPEHRWSPAETLSRFRQSRTRTLELLTDAPCLRGHVVPHPVAGPWDGYQWILAAGAHGARHTGQILEVKASSGFGETQAASPAGRALESSRTESCDR